METVRSEVKTRRTRRASRDPALPPQRGPTYGIRPLFWAPHTAAGSRRLRPLGSVGRSRSLRVPRTPCEGEYGDPDSVPSFPAPPTPLLPLPWASPGAAGRGRIPTEAEAEALQLLHVATQPVMEDARQEAARCPARGHGYRLAARTARGRAGLTSDFRFWVLWLPGEFCFRGHSEWRVRATHVACERVERRAGGGSVDVLEQRVESGG